MSNAAAMIGNAKAKRSLAERSLAERRRSIEQLRYA